MAESIRAVFNTNAQVLRFLPDDGPPLLDPDWMTGEKKPGSILFITSNYTDLRDEPGAADALDRTSRSTRLMTMPRTRDPAHLVHVRRARRPPSPAGDRERPPDRPQLRRRHDPRASTRFDKLVEVYGEENARNLVVARTHQADPRRPPISTPPSSARATSATARSARWMRATATATTTPATPRR